MAVEIRHSGQTVVVVSRHTTAIVRSPSWKVEEISGILTGGTPYPGPYEVTPGEDEQVLDTEQKTLSGNLVVKPIPSNYGRIEWDGTSILVY